MVSVSDLFCGMGGLSYGFSVQGFDVKGYDINKYSNDIFQINNIGKFEQLNLDYTRVNSITGLTDQLLSVNNNIDSDIIIGGPSCKPWSTVNITKRKKTHPDYGLVESFFRIINNNEPDIFLMENVPPIKNDGYYLRCINNIRKKYHVSNLEVSYDQFGAATKRIRLITVGFKNRSPLEFIFKLIEEKHPPLTVRDAFNTIKDIKRGSLDHEWPNLKTINKYKKYYDEGKYGWYKLEWDKPAPSFGNVMKTYILHPEEERVVSVREVMTIMGFPKKFIFPKYMGHTKKYQMIADVVSPKFSEICAKILKEMI